MRSHHPCLCCPSIHSVVSNESVNRICPKTRVCMALPMLCEIYFADREEYELITPDKNEKKKNNKFLYCKISLRKHAYSNIQKNSPPEPENFQIKTDIFFRISAHNIDCGYSLEPPRRGGSNEYLTLCFEQK